ncbi:MAG: type II secretion system protein [Verrucomicrobia bacterium]|nr:MAG: type II secretion system protein [Verrucomicrobiota bacterium]
MKSLLIHISSVLKSMKPFSRLHGFTVIELLIVITIIGILASLLTPTIQSSLEHAKAAKCLGNLHQVGTDVLSYIADPMNNNKFPPFFDVSASELTPLTSLSNYGLTLATLTCPSDPKPDPKYGSYLWNAVPDTDDAASMKRYGRSGRVTIISKISKLQLATDGHYGATAGFPHPGNSFNVLWADGHVTVSNALISTIH